MAQFKRVTAASAVAISFCPYIGQAWKLLEVRLNLDTAASTSENLVISTEDAADSEYDTTLLTKDMATVKSIVYAPDGEGTFKKDESINIAWDNTDARTYGITIVYDKG